MRGIDHRTNRVTKGCSNVRRLHRSSQHNGRSLSRPNRACRKLKQWEFAPFNCPTEPYESYRSSDSIEQFDGAVRWSSSAFASDSAKEVTSEAIREMLFRQMYSSSNCKKKKKKTRNQRNTMQQSVDCQNEHQPKFLRRFFL